MNLPTSYGQIKRLYYRYNTLSFGGATHLSDRPDPVLAPRQLAQAQEGRHRQAAQVLRDCRQRDLPRFEVKFSKNLRMSTFLIKFYLPAINRQLRAKQN